MLKVWKIQKNEHQMKAIVKLMVVTTRIIIQALRFIKKIWIFFNQNSN